MTSPTLSRVRTSRARPTSSKLIRVLFYFQSICQKGCGHELFWGERCVSCKNNEKSESEHPHFYSLLYFLCLILRQRDENAGDLELSIRSPKNETETILCLKENKSEAHH